MFRGWFNKNNAVELNDDDDTEKGDGFDLAPLEESVPPVVTTTKAEEEAKRGATAPASSSWFARTTKDDKPAEVSTKTTSSPWFTKTPKTAADEHNDGGLGGFGAVDSFSTDPFVDPREQNKKTVEPTTPAKIAPRPSKKEVVAEPDSDSSSSSDNEDDDDDDSDSYSDDHTMDESTVGGPLFDESAYSVNEDEYSVDTFDISAQEGEWRQQKANDFLADFYAERADQKKKKQEKKEKLIASKNKYNTAASFANALANAASEEENTDDNGFPAAGNDSLTCPSSSSSSSREISSAKESPEQASDANEIAVVSKRRLSTGTPRRLSAAGAPKFESIPENGEFESHKEPLEDAFENNYDTTPKAFDDSVGDSFASSAFSGKIPDLNASTCAGDSMRTDQSDVEPTRSPRRASVESTGTFANYEPRCSSNSDSFSLDAGNSFTSHDFDSNELGKVHSDGEEDEASERDDVVISDEEEDDDTNERSEESSLCATDNVENELDLSADFDQSMFSADFEQSVAPGKSQDSVAHETKEEKQLSGDDVPTTKSLKTKKGVVDDDSDISDPDEPELGNHPSHLFGYAEANIQQATFEDDEASLDSTPSVPKRSKSGDILLGKHSDHSKRSEVELQTERAILSGSKRAGDDNTEQAWESTSPELSQKKSIEPMNGTTVVPSELEETLDYDNYDEGISESNECESIEPQIADDSGHQSSRSTDAKACSTMNDSIADENELPVIPQNIMEEAETRNDSEPDQDDGSSVSDSCAIAIDKTENDGKLGPEKGPENEEVISLRNHGNVSAPLHSDEEGDDSHSDAQEDHGIGADLLECHDDSSSDFVEDKMDEHSEFGGSQTDSEERTEAFLVSTTVECESSVQKISEENSSRGGRQDPEIRIAVSALLSPNEASAHENEFDERGEQDSHSTSVSSLVTPKQGVRRGGEEDDEGSSVSSLATTPGAGFREDGSISSESESEEIADDAEPPNSESYDNDVASGSSVGDSDRSGSSAAEAEGSHNDGNDSALLSREKRDSSIGDDQSGSQPREYGGAYDDFDSGMRGDFQSNESQSDMSHHGDYETRDPNDDMGCFSLSEDMDDTVPALKETSNHDDRYNGQIAKDDETSVQRMGDFLTDNHSLSAQDQSESVDASELEQCLFENNDMGDAGASSTGSSMEDNAPEDGKFNFDIGGILQTGASVLTRTGNSKEPTERSDQINEFSMFVQGYNSADPDSQDRQNCDPLSAASTEASIEELLGSREGQQAKDIDEVLHKEPNPGNIHALQSTVMYFYGDICETDVVQTLTTSLSHVGDIDMINVMDESLPENLDLSPPGDAEPTEPLESGGEDVPTGSSHTVDVSPISEDETSCYADLQRSPETSANSKVADDTALALTADGEYDVAETIVVAASMADTDEAEAYEHETTKCDSDKPELESSLSGKESFGSVLVNEDASDGSEEADNAESDNQDVTHHIQLNEDDISEASVAASQVNSETEESQQEQSQNEEDSVCSALVNGDPSDDSKDTSDADFDTQDASSHSQLDENIFEGSDVTTDVVDDQADEPVQEKTRQKKEESVHGTLVNEDTPCGSESVDEHEFDYGKYTSDRSGSPSEVHNKTNDCEWEASHSRGGSIHSKLVSKDASDKSGADAAELETQDDHIQPNEDNISEGSRDASEYNGKIDMLEQERSPGREESVYCAEVDAEPVDSSAADDEFDFDNADLSSQNQPEDSEGIGVTEEVELFRHGGRDTSDLMAEGSSNIASLHSSLHGSSDDIIVEEDKASLFRASLDESAGDAEIASVLSGSSAVERVLEGADEAVSESLCQESSSEKVEELPSSDADNDKFSEHAIQESTLETKFKRNISSNESTTGAPLSNSESSQQDACEEAEIRKTADNPMAEYSCECIDKDQGEKPNEDKTEAKNSEEVTKAESKPKSSWGMGLFSSKQSSVKGEPKENKEKNENAPAHTQDSLPDKKDLTGSDSSVDRRTTGSNIGESDVSRMGVKEAKEESTESSKGGIVEETKSLAAKEKETTAEAPKVKSSWGFSLFSSKPKGSEVTDTKSSDKEVPQSIQKADDLPADAIPTAPDESNSPPLVEEKETTKRPEEIETEPNISEPQEEDTNESQKEKEEKPKSSWGFKLFSRKPGQTPDKDMTDQTTKESDTPSSDDVQFASVDISADSNAIGTDGDGEVANPGGDRKPSEENSDGWSIQEPATNGTSDLATRGYDTSKEDGPVLAGVQDESKGLDNGGPILTGKDSVLGFGETEQSEPGEEHSVDDKDDSTNSSHNSAQPDPTDSKVPSKTENKSKGIFGLGMFSPSTSRGDTDKPAGAPKEQVTTEEVNVFSSLVNSGDDSVDPSGPNEELKQDDSAEKTDNPKSKSIFGFGLFTRSKPSSKEKGDIARDEEYRDERNDSSLQEHQDGDESQSSCQMEDASFKGLPCDQISQDDDVSATSDDTPATTNAKILQISETASDTESVRNDARPYGACMAGYGTDSETENENRDLQTKPLEEDSHEYGTDGDSENQEVQSVSSDFRDNELSRAMKLLNDDFDDESVMTELESRSPAVPFSMDDSSEEEEDEAVKDDELAEDLSSSDEVEEAKSPGNKEDTIGDTNDRPILEPVQTLKVNALEDTSNKAASDVENPETSERAGESEEEEDGDESEDDDSDDDDDSEQEEEEQAAQVVVKEAPLLRLENVTAQTRSKIPENRKQKKIAGWNWLFAGKEKKEDTEKQDNDPEDKELDDDKVTEDDKEATSSMDAEVDMGASTDVNSGAIIDQPESSEKPIPSEGKADFNIESKKKKKEKKQKKEKKAKKEKKDKGLASHFSKTKVRTFSRHGDEVSVGTMNLKSKRGDEQQHIVISHSHRASTLDDNLDLSKEERPWDRDAPNRKPAKLQQSDLTAHMAIQEGSEGSEGSDDSDAITGVSGTLDSLFSNDAFSTAGTQDGIDALSQMDGLTQADTISLSALENKLQSNTADEEVNFDDMWDNMSADVSTAQEYEKKQRENFRKKKEKKKSSRKNEDDEDGDDVKRLRLFEKHSEKESKKGKKGKRGKKKKEKLSMEFLTAIREVFDEDEEGDSDDDDDGGSFGSPEDDSRGTRTQDDDDDDDDKSEMSMFIGAKQYMGNKRRGDNDELGSAGSEEDESVAESEDGSYADGKRSNDDDASESRSRRSHRTKNTQKTGRSSKRTSRTSRSSNSRSSKAKRKPAEVLQDEIKRQQGGKLLSVSSLKQEMSDRRGTSVELLKKEFEKKKREKAANEERLDVFEDPLIGRDLGTTGFGGFSSGFGSGGGFGSSGGFGSKSDPFGGGAFEASFSDLNQGSDDLQAQSSGLGGHLSRWADKEAVSDLDDLRTVQQDTAINTNDGSSFGFGPPTSIIQSLPDTMPSIPVDLLATGATSSSSKSKKTSKKKQIQDPFAPSFDDPMPMTTITEIDDDDDNQMGLLASSSSQQDDDDMSYRSTRSNRSRRFGLGGLKGPKLKSIGKLMSKKKGSSDSKASSSGFFGDDDYDAGGGLLG